MFESIEIPLLLISVIAGGLIGIPTGPANFFIVDTYMKEGRWDAVKVYTGLVGAKLIYAVLALLANELIKSNPDIEAIVYIVASFMLMAWGAFIIIKSKKKNSKAIELNIKSELKKGFVLGISNPAIPFVHLAFVQLLNVYSQQALEIFAYAFYIIIFETMTFVVISLVAFLLMIKKGKVLKHWSKVKMGMGILIICIGLYHVYQRVGFKNGIHLKNGKSSLEKNIKKLEIEK